MSSGEKTYNLTLEGFKRLEKRLKEHKTRDRQEIAEKIRQAKEFGEISENTEYEDAKAEQARLEQEIAKLEKIIRNAKILEKRETDKVELGTQVRVRFEEENREITFELVGTQESDPSHTVEIADENDPSLKRRVSVPRISDESPVGMALMGKGVGEKAEVYIPIGIAHYEILGINSI